MIYRVWFELGDDIDEEIVSHVEAAVELNEMEQDEVRDAIGRCVLDEESPVTDGGVEPMRPLSYNLFRQSFPVLWESD